VFLLVSDPAGYTMSLGKLFISPGVEQVIFFVAELTFANWDHWTAK